MHTKVTFKSSTDKPRILSSRHYLWHVNEFCKVFKPNSASLTPLQDFVEQYRVNSSNSTSASPDEDDDSAQLDDTDTSLEAYDFDDSATASDASQTQLYQITGGNFL